MCGTAGFLGGTEGGGTEGFWCGTEEGMLN